MGEKNYVYMVRCGNGSLYTGWTNDLGRRIRAHRTGKGAKYTRGFGAKGVVYLEQLEDKSAALRREAQLKALPKVQKEALVQEWCRENRPPIQLGGVEDAPQIAQLYRWYVSNSTATFQTSLPTDQEYGQWVEDTLKTAPLLVMKDRTGKLLGYACAHPFPGSLPMGCGDHHLLRPRCAGEGSGDPAHVRLVGGAGNAGILERLCPPGRPKPGQ